MFVITIFIGKKKFINKDKDPKKKHPKIISILKEEQFILKYLQKLFPYPVIIIDVTRIKM